MALLQLALQGLLELIYPVVPIRDYPIAYVLLPVLAAYLFGLGPALLAFVLATLGLMYDAIPPRRAWPVIYDRDVAARLTAYLLYGALTVAGIAIIRRGERNTRMLADKLQFAQSAAGAGLWDWDIRTRRLELSSEMHRLLGTTPGAALEFDDWLRTASPEDRDALRESLDRALEQGADLDAEFRVVHPDGSVHWLNALGRPIYDAGGRPVRFMGLCMDSTERKKAEEEERRLNASLERHATQLEAVNKELEAFSYSISHDLRAPLRSIDGFSQALVEDYADKLNDTGKDYVRRVRGATERMAGLIDDILKLSRVTRAGMHQRDIDLSAMASEIAYELRAGEPDRRVDFIIPAGITARGDPELLRVALQNLLANAWKFTGKHPRARIELGVTQSDGEQVYFVRDDGAGFDPHYAGKLFGAFQRLHAPDEFPGTGIGLATVQRIVARHGGRVWAEGEVEKGATFYLTIPGMETVEEAETAKAA